MDQFEKYTRLSLLLLGGLICFIAGLALIFFLLRLTSITLFHLPGFAIFFEYSILAIPYLVFYTAYLYLARKIIGAKKLPLKIIASVLLFTGLLICTVGLIVTVMANLGAHYSWLLNFKQYSNFPLIIQLIIVLFIAGVLASGDAKEKDWMERRNAVE